MENVLGYQDLHRKFITLLLSCLFGRICKQRTKALDLGKTPICLKGGSFG